MPQFIRWGVMMAVPGLYIYTGVKWHLEDYGCVPGRGAIYGVKDWSFRPAGYIGDKWHPALGTGDLRPGDGPYMRADSAMWTGVFNTSQPYQKPSDIAYHVGKPTQMGNPGQPIQQEYWENMKGKGAAGIAEAGTTKYGSKGPLNFLSTFGIES